MDLNAIDPGWAWGPYEPDLKQPWNRRRAAHLLWRAGYGATIAELDQAVSRSPQEAVDQLVSTAEPAAFAGQMDTMATQTVAGGKARELTAWWLYRLLHTPVPLLERCTVFWHGHFATSAEKVEDAELMYQQNRLLRREALGDFNRLAHDIARDPAMLIYLDSATNRKAHPNENFARELMELFCLGEGNYTEQDILELARCFTGWEVRRKKFRFNRYQHDTGVKTILRQRGEFGGEEGVDVVLAQDACPYFIARKLFHYFVCDEPEAPDALIEPLAHTFRERGLQIAPLVRRILSSNLFFSHEVFGRKVRSPVDLAVGLARSLEITTNLKELSNELEKLGQVLIFPPNVKGWDGGRTWINSSTLLGRANLVADMVDHENTKFAGDSLEAFVTRMGWESPDDLVNAWSELLLAVPLQRNIRIQLVTVAQRGPQELLRVWGSLPEMQLG